MGWDFKWVTYNNKVVMEVFEEYTLTSINPQPNIKADSDTTLNDSTSLDYIARGYTLYSSQENYRHGEKVSTKRYPSATGNWEIYPESQIHILIKKDSQKINYYNNIIKDETGYTFEHSTYNGELVVFGAEQNFAWSSMIFNKN